MTPEQQGTDWQAWHRDYDDPASPVSQRLVEVRRRLTADLASRSGRIRLLSLCSGDARDTTPVVAAADHDVSVCLVELDPDLAEGARRAAADAGVEVDVRTGDAGDPTTYADVLPVDVLLLVGVLGNVSDADARTTVAAAASMLRPGGTVLWTRSDRFRAEPTHDAADPAVWVRGLFESLGFETLAFVVPEEGHWRLGVSRLATPSDEPWPGRLFTFVR
jgi:uncharacterized SAM-dependent methyltransferase